MFSFSQTQQLNKLTQPENNFREHIEFNANVASPLTNRELQLITEAFGSKTQSLVLDNAAYLQDLKNLLRNRIRIEKVSDASKQKKVRLLSEIPLNKTHNPAVTREQEFNINTFNPLKYQMDFFSNGTYLYRVDDTDYFITITSQYRK
jgi:hypothetical protein